MINGAILAVEDEPDGQELISRMLKIANVAVDIASDAEQAWEMLSTQAYGLAIIDLALPGMSGNELLRQIRATPELAGLPCIAVTAYHTPELKQQCLAEGFDAYFPKPIDRTLLIGTLESMTA
jgi:CheY-like chemotaxis protein